MKARTPHAASRLLRLHLAPWRLALVGGLLLAGFVAVGARAFYWQGVQPAFLQDKSDAVSNRDRTLVAPRGRIIDRGGYQLAVSTPVESLWGRPDELTLDPAQRLALAEILGVAPQQLNRKLVRTTRGEFSIARPVTPQQALQISELGAPGLHLRREFRRYYPSREVAAHVVGFTDIDGVGREGVERAYQALLVGEAGERRILRDRHGQPVRDLMPVKAARNGTDLALALDHKLQYLAHRELAAAIVTHKAKGGSVVVLDAQTGEILALANQPVFNPNNRDNYRPQPMRNRAVIDTFEPGSTIKPFVAAAALERGLYTPESIISTPASLQVGRKRVRDVHWAGPQMSVTQIIQKSSNVGAVRLGMALSPGEYWDVLHRIGLGQKPGSGFPGETAGRLRAPATWRPVEHATMSYGYGMSVSLLQLARAYMAFANDGVVVPVTFLKREPHGIQGERVFSADVARAVRGMMETVTAAGGTGTRTRVPGYRVAGKTGTAHKVVDGRYAADRYLSSFVGMAPASNPRLIIAVTIDEPSGGVYYGGSTAGPVFAAVMGASLRQLGLPPDAPETLMQPPAPAALPVRLTRTPPSRIPELPAWSDGAEPPEIDEVAGDDPPA